MQPIGVSARSLTDRFGDTGEGGMSIPLGWQVCRECNGASRTDNSMCNCLGGIVRIVACGYCNDLKFVCGPAKLGEKGFGRAIPCPACNAGNNSADSAARRLAFSHVPEKYKGKTIEGLAGECNRLGLDYAPKATAANVARVMAENPGDYWTRAPFKTDRIDKKGYMIVGSVGAGKSCLAAAVMYKMAEHYPSVYWVSWGIFLHELQLQMDRTDSGDSYEDKFSRPVNAGFLVIDDFGAMFGKSREWRAQMAWEILERRGNAPMIVTTMLNESQLIEQFGDHVISRLMEVCHICVMGGANFRRGV